MSDALAESQAGAERHAGEPGIKGGGDGSRFREGFPHVRRT